jgi:type IV secretory pathway VirB2 component (pilin)
MVHPKFAEQEHSVTRRIVTFTSQITLIFLLSTPVAAQSVSPGTCSQATAEPIQNLVTLINQLADWGIALGLSIAVLGLIAAGIRAIQGRWEAARQLFIRTVIGVAVILLAQGFVNEIARLLC